MPEFFWFENHDGLITIHCYTGSLVGAEQKSYAKTGIVFDSYEKLIVALIDFLSKKGMQIKSIDTRNNNTFVCSKCKMKPRLSEIREPYRW